MNGSRRYSYVKFRAFFLKGAEIDRIIVERRPRADQLLMQVSDSSPNRYGGLSDDRVIQNSDDPQGKRGFDPPADV